MKDLEKNIAAELSNEPELVFNASDDELFKRATTTVNNQQATKDLMALGMASIWVVFISMFMNLLKPLFKRIKTDTVNINTSKNEIK